ASFAWATASGQLELNVFFPVAAHVLIEAETLLATAAQAGRALHPRSRRGPRALRFLRGELAAAGARPGAAPGLRPRRGDRQARGGGAPHHRGAGGGGGSAPGSRGARAARPREARGGLSGLEETRVALELWSDAPRPLRVRR